MAASDGVHSSVKAIQDMEAACARFSRVLVDRLPEIERELRQVTEALEDRRSDLRREIANLQDTISNAGEDDDVSWETHRLGDAEDELASVQRRSRSLSEMSVAYMEQARNAEHLANSHSIRTREFLNGAADDLKAYLDKQSDGNDHPSGTTGTNYSIVSHKPVSAAMHIDIDDPSLRLDIQRALAAIDEVHRDGVLQQIPVRSLQTGSAKGEYRRRRNSDGSIVSDYIAIRDSGSWPAFTMLHETGHFLDFEAIGPKGKHASTAADPDMTRVLQAAERTEAIRYLRAQLGSRQDPDTIEALNEMLLPNEIWARAYAQFVAGRSSDESLHHDLQNALLFGKQWQSEDFLVIGSEIEAMFRKLNWL